MKRIIAAIALILITITIWPLMIPAVTEMLLMAKGTSEFQDLLIDLVPYGVPVAAVIIAILMIVLPGRRSDIGGMGGLQ